MKKGQVKIKIKFIEGGILTGIVSINRAIRIIKLLQTFPDLLAYNSKSLEEV